MARGGTGRGQGRKNKLDYLGRIWVLSRYKELVREAEHLNTIAKIKEINRKDEIEEQRELFKNLSVRKTHKYNGRNERQVASGLAFALAPIPDPSEQYPEHVIEGAIALRDVKNTLDSRPRLYPVKRINSEAPLIRKKVAEEATIRFGITISDQYVKRICDDRKHEYRELTSE